MAWVLLELYGAQSLLASGMFGVGDGLLGKFGLFAWPLLYRFIPQPFALPVDLGEMNFS